METNALLIIGNIIVVLAHGLDFLWSFLFNNKNRILRENMVSSIMSIIANICFQALGGVITSSVTLARIITIYIKDKYHKKFVIPFIIICGMYLFSLRDWRGLPSILLVCSMFCSFIPKWFSQDVQKLRIGALFANMLIIPYEFLVANYAGIGMACINIVTVLINIVKWIPTMQKTKNT